MKINFSDLKYIITEAAKILTEITVQDASQKYYQDIPSNDFMEIITSLQGNNNILQPETKWALGLYKKKSPRFMEDLYKLHNERGDGYLDIFKRAKDRRIISGQESDLNRFKSISELGAFLNTLDKEQIMGRTKGEMSNAVNSAANDATKLYEDERWLLVSPNTYEASVYWGKDTEWCTATRESDHWYEYYTKQGPLYINIDKQNNTKYQFHFESESYMDSDDCDIDRPILTNMGATDGLIKWYEKNMGKLHVYDLQYEIFEEEETLRVYENEDGEYFIIETTWLTPVINQWVKNYYFDMGAIRFSTMENGKEKWHVWESQSGEVIEGSYDFIGEFDEEVAYVLDNKKYNFIDTQGEVIFDQWFDDCDDCGDGYDVVVLNGKKNVFSRERKELLLDTWVDAVSSTVLDAFAEVEINGVGMNIITNSDELLFPYFVEEVMYNTLYNGEGWWIPFKYKGKWNFFNFSYGRKRDLLQNNKQLYSETWFDDITDLYAVGRQTGADVKIDGVDYYLDMDDDVLRNFATGEIINLRK